MPIAGEESAIHTTSHYAPLHPAYISREFAIESCFVMSSTSPQSSASSSTATQRDPVPMLDLTRQYETIKDDVHAAIERVLTTQHFIGGPELEGFECESASYLGVNASVGCASGTDALWMALKAGG